MDYASLSMVLILLLGVLSWSPAYALERIRIGLSVRNVVFLPFYYAQEKKIFEKHGLNAELIQMRSDLQVVGLVSGEIDFTPVIGPTVFAIANGMPLKATAVLYKAPLFSLLSPADGYQYQKLGRKAGRRVPAWIRQSPIRSHDDGE
jgi:ABC-type nitrate/sulfonate/bicarbonate transport system substrate-binding protein